MADKKISELPVATAPTGTELMEVVQGGVNKQLTAQQIADLGGGGGGAVDSVNGQTGVVVLDAGDVGADPAGSASTVATNLTDHINDTSDAHDASAISFAPAGSIAATDVQAALEELDTDVQGKADKSLTINTQTADYTLALVDAGNVVSMNLTGTANNLTVPPNSTVAFPIGTQITVKQNGTGITTIVEGAGVTITPPAGGGLVSPGQGQPMVLLKTGTNTWDLYNGNAPSALTKTDDTNVTLTLGGSPTLALLAPTSITVGWSGILTTSRGGTGSSAFKHQRVTTGSITAGTSAVVTLTWTSPFADANYTVTCSVEDSTAATASLVVVHIEAKAANTVQVRISNTSAGSLTGTLNCIAVHD